MINSLLYFYSYLLKSQASVNKNPFWPHYLSSFVSILERRFKMHKLSIWQAVTHKVMYQKQF